jgi:hypothetical protein
MQTLGVLLEPHIIPGTLEVNRVSHPQAKQDKAGNVTLVDVFETILYAEMEWHWVLRDDPTQRVVIPWVLIGQHGDSAQAFGSALTYSRRYFLLKFFGVATVDDDPEHWKGKAAEASDREITEVVKSQIHTAITEHLEAHPDDRAELTALLKQHIKIGGKPSANYMALKKPADVNVVLAQVHEFITTREQAKPRPKRATATAKAAADKEEGE